MSGREADNSFKARARAFVPSLPNALVEGVLRLMSFFDHVPGRLREQNRRENDDIWVEKYSRTYAESFIEDQALLKDLKLGKSDMAYAGCEIIAVYNALLDRKKLEETLPGLISCFEKKGVVLNGRFGTAPRALARYLRSIGIGAEYSIRRKDFPLLAERSAVFIVTAYNDYADIMQEIHTVCITKEPDGRFRAHNSRKCRESVEGFDALEQALGVGGRGKILAMTGIIEKGE